MLTSPTLDLSLELRLIYPTYLQMPIQHFHLMISVSYLTCPKPAQFLSRPHWLPSLPSDVTALYKKVHCILHIPLPWLCFLYRVYHPDCQDIVWLSL